MSNYQKNFSNPPMNPNPPVSDQLTPLEITPYMNMNNIENVRGMIRDKQSNIPFYGTAQEAGSVVTDIDHHPYSRYYRGVYYSSKPIVFEREAGWRPIREDCYKVSTPPEDRESGAFYPNHCFEAPCSTVYPCYPQYLQKFSDRDALNVQLNRACIVQYR